MWHTYHLPNGKLDAFTNLMARSDVPILVRPSPEGIDIQATKRQHSVFQAFFQTLGLGAVPGHDEQRDQGGEDQNDSVFHRPGP